MNLTPFAIRMMRVGEKDLPETVGLPWDYFARRGITLGDGQIEIARGKREPVLLAHGWRMPAGC